MRLLPRRRFSLPSARWRHIAGSAVLGFGVLGGVGPLRALDFQLHSMSVEEDGFTREQFYFPNDERSRIFILLPHDWTPAAVGSSLSLTNQAAPGSLIRLEKSALTPNLPFKDKGLETYRTQALSLVPGGSTAVKIVEQNETPLRIFNWTNYEFVLSYEFYGQTYRRSVMFLNLNAKEQLVTTALAPAASYDTAHTLLFDLLRSWQVMPLQASATSP